MKTILIAGLGNPGKKYEKTRHNVGFMFVDYFFEKFRDEFGFSDWKFSKKTKSEISIGKINEGKNKIRCCNLLATAKRLQHGKSEKSGSCKIVLLKPQTFMNFSGEAVLAAKKYYGIKIEEIFVNHDDIDLVLGKYKISTDSSSAGHNGAQNIIDTLGTKNFTRLRIGVENRGEKKIATEKYVLGKFTAAEMKIILKILPSISDELFSLSLRA
jgi:peptidyl-tRNA hydrolase, PTH1 family